jgi:TRAP transporter TAXI family solute receptor
MARIWNSKVPGVNVTAQATGASAENVRLINKKEVELALVQSDTIDFAYHAKETFKERLTKMNALAVLYPEIVQIVVRKDSNISSFGDLKGVKTGVGAPGSGTEANFRQLLEAHGMKKEDVKAQYLSFAESAEQFKDRHIDAFIVVAGIPNPAIMDVAVMQSIRILSLPDDRVAHLTRKYPFLSPAVVPPNTYKNQSFWVRTIAVSAVLIASADLKEGVVYDKNGVKITAFEVDHFPGKDPEPCFGYRIDYAGRSVVLSGDTRFSENLISFSNGADVLVHEVAAAKEELLRTSVVTQRIIDHHTSPEEAGKVFSRVKPKLAVYSHFVQVAGETMSPPTVEDIITMTRKTYSGPLEAGEDLMVIEIGDTAKVSPPYK